MGFGQMLQSIKGQMQSDAEGIVAKKKNVDAYQSGTSTPQASADQTRNQSAPVDRVNPGGRYGDRKGERRLSFGNRIGGVK